MRGDIKKDKEKITKSMQDNNMKKEQEREDCKREDRYRVQKEL